MVLDIWNYLKGYVIIEVTGFSVERFVNLAVHKGIYVWDVEMGAGKVRMKVSARGFKELKPCARKTKCKYRIIEKKGYPFTAYKYRKRKLFAAGIVMFAVFLFFLSSFVWLVEVEGNNRVSGQEILDFCKERGLSAGAFKSGVDRKEIERQMLLNFTDISFINIGVKGTKATVTISETLPEKAIEDRSTPCNIIAEKDGLIVSVVASSGDPIVKAKDVAQKGDVLISGELSINRGDGTQVKEYVHAGGEVLAKLFYEINFNVQNTYIEKRYTGQYKAYYSFNILNKDINILKASNLYGNYDKITERKQLSAGGSFFLPVTVIKDVYREYTPIAHKRDLAQMFEIAEIIVNDRIAKEYQPEAEVIDRRLEYLETEEGISVKAFITTIENIGVKAPVDFLSPTE